MPQIDHHVALCTPLPLVGKLYGQSLITVLKKDLIELNVVAAFSQKLERTHGSSSNKLEFNCKKSNGFWFHKQLQFNFHVKLEWFKLEICLTPFVRCIFNFKVIIMIQKYHMIFRRTYDFFEILLDFAIFNEFVTIKMII